MAARDVVGANYAAGSRSGGNGNDGAYVFFAGGGFGRARRGQRRMRLQLIEQGFYMKRNIRMASLVLAGLLHIAPIASRVAQVAPALAKSPLAIVMTWAIRVAALAGAYHTVSAASITTQPVGTGLHVGETLNLSVAATGTAPLTYKWQKDAVDIPGATASTFTIAAVDASAGSSYRAIGTGAGGSATSNAAVITVTPLSIQLQTHTAGSTTFLLTTVPGRHYFLQATTSLGAAPWEAAGEITATTSSTAIGDQSPDTSVRIWRYYPGP